MLIGVWPRGGGGAGGGDLRGLAGRSSLQPSYHLSVIICEGI